jgi:inner membrane protein involved in colicin E2 resistance
VKRSEFEKFDNVMGGILAVPYSELQKKLEEEKQGKAKRKKQRTTSLLSPAFLLPVNGDGRGLEW